MATREELKDKRGLMVSVIMDDSRLRKVWAPEMADWTDDNDVTRNFWVEDSVTRVLAMGHVTTVPQFRLRFNKWMENPPKRFSIPQLLLLEHTMGVPSHEWERLPVYCHRYPHPDGMSDADAGRANARQSEAWSRFCRMTDECTRTFGDDDMCNEFDSKTSGVTFKPSEKIFDVPEGVTRVYFASGKAMLEDWQANAAKWSEVLDTNDIDQMMLPDGRFVFDIVPHTTREVYDACFKAFVTETEAA